MMKKVLLLLWAGFLSLSVAAQSSDKFNGTYEKKVVQTFKFSEGLLGKKIWLNKYYDGQPYHIDSKFFNVSTASASNMATDANGWYGSSSTGRFYTGNLPDWHLIISLNDAAADYYVDHVKIDCYYPDRRDKHFPELEKGTPGTFVRSLIGKNTETFTYTPNQYWFSTIKINISWMYHVRSVMLVLREKPQALKKSVPDETFTVRGVRFKMIGVPGGQFVMGPDTYDPKDGPAHNVTLSDYLIGETEVTQELWEAVMGNNPSKKKGASLPVNNLYYHDAQNFARRLSQLTGRDFYVPTEAQWEYAALGGPYSKGYVFSGSNVASDVGWFFEKSGGSSLQAVKTKRPNELGIYDMSGNAIEWVSDPSGRYPTKPVKDPQVGEPWGNEKDSHFILRGQMNNDNPGWGLKRRYPDVYNEEFMIKVLVPGLRIALKPEK